VNASCAIEAVDSECKTALHHACIVGFPNVIKILAEADVDLNARDTKGWGGLHYAVQGRGEHLVQELLLAKADANALNTDARSPLDMARRIGSREIVSLLHNAGGYRKACCGRV